MRNLIFILILIPYFSHAQMDEHKEKALKQTTDLLKDSSERQKAINQDSKAKEMDAKVDALAGSSENKEEMYSIAAGIMEKLAKEANGDPDKMQALLLEAQKNPQAFYQKYFDDGQKKKVSTLAGKIQKNAPTVGGAK